VVTFSICLSVIPAAGPQTLQITSRRLRHREDLVSCM
jgi:hypothetical protein